MATGCVSTSSAKKSSKNYSLDWDLEEIRRYKDEDCFTYNGNRIKWTDSFEMLRLFIECSIELPGTWSTPGGKYKKFTSSVSDLILTWNYDLFTLSFRGVERARLKEILIHVCTMANKDLELASNTCSGNAEVAQIFDPKANNNKTVNSDCLKPLYSLQCDCKCSLLAAGLEGIRLEVTIMQKDIKSMQYTHG